MPSERERSYALAIAIQALAVALLAASIASLARGH